MTCSVFVLHRLIQLPKTVVYHSPPRFGMFLYIGAGALIHLMAQLHSLCGPLTGEATEGSSQVVARTAVQVSGSEPSRFLRGSS